MSRTLPRLAGALAVLAAAVAVVPVALGDSVGERALAAARGQLRTDLSAGGVSLSLLRDFPHVSVAIEDVRLGGYPAGDLLVAERVSARMSYADLVFADAWTFSRVTVSGGELDVARTAERVGNWLVLPPRADPSAPPPDVRFALEEIVLDDVLVRYDDAATETLAEVQVDDARLAGDFAADAYTLTGELAGWSYFLDLGERRYVEDFPLAAALSLDIDPRRSAYDFGPTTLTLDGMPVDVEGAIAVEREAVVYDLRLATDEGRLGPLLRALPREWVTPAIRSLETAGAFHLDGTVVGAYDARHAPAVDFAGALRHGSLSLPALGREARDVSFALTYTNHQDGREPGMRASRLRLNSVAARLDGQPLSGDFAWENFDDPYYDTRVSGELPLAWFDEVWAGGTLAGDLLLDGVRVRGRQRHMLDGRYASKVRTEGRLGLRDVVATYHGEPLALEASALRIEGPNVVIDGGVVAGLGNALTADLTLGNVVPHMLGDETQVLSFDGAIATPHIDLDRWVGLFGGAGTPGERGGEDEPADAPLAEGLEARLDLRADRVDYNDVRASRFGGSCTLAASELRLRGEGYAMEGHWEVDGAMQLRTRPTLGAKLACSEVNITELFEQTDDVGQGVVEARHLDGEMTARAYVEAAWDADAELLPERLHVWANVGLTDGGLRDFEMLQALSRYVRSEDLREVRFTDVENWIEVVDERVYLPAMFIQSSATNFTVAGEHSFAHDIDYAVRVNGAQVLLTKLLGKRPGVEFLPDRRGGWVKTGFKIDGTLAGGDYDVRMAGPEVRRDLRHSVRRKAAIRRKLAGLFGAGSLIDDYDDEGVRRGDRPASRSRVGEAGRPEAAGRAAPTAPVVDVDPGRYLDWSAEERPLGTAPDGGVPAARRPVLSGLGADGPAGPPRAERAREREPRPSRRPPARTAGVGPRPRPGAIVEPPAPRRVPGPGGTGATAPAPRSRPPAPADEPGEDDFLEGFDEIQVPD